MESRNRKSGFFDNALFQIRNKVKIKKNNTVVLGSGVRVRKCNISIKGSGNTLTFEDGANLKGVQLEIDGINCALTIGKNCVIGEGCYLSARESNTSLTIGNDCMFSRNVKVMTSDGHDILSSGARINPAKNINIGNHVWLADGVIVLKGSNIGDGSIIGINAVVTRDVPAHSIAAGNPAKTIKSDVHWDEKLTYSS
ncbi:hexapeptide transferase [Enterovibrio norvegicus FF-162]|uniref:Hexapeptide transferase n=1 Tax=Enterovibrio norvegicus FF-454 TaxID=1185651 RepID=A0A1E5CG03_9GAMM|nr:acyltransferase [Enterovibrio norvegicus]OEE64395.1 hexapeptide transferase [Enterovibrio norvegicus FF-454]OEE87562.1 hexapeptide transferase [Enterovibrio norvegicus FF-162]